MFLFPIYTGCILTIYIRNWRLTGLFWDFWGSLRLLCDQSWGHIDDLKSLRSSKTKYTLCTLYIYPSTLILYKWCLLACKEVFIERKMFVNQPGNFCISLLCRSILSYTRRNNCFWLALLKLLDFLIFHTAAVKTDMIELITNFKRRETAWSLAWAVRSMVWAECMGCWPGGAAPGISSSRGHDPGPRNRETASRHWVAWIGQSLNTRSSILDIYSIESYPVRLILLKYQTFLGIINFRYLFGIFQRFEA